MTLNETALMVKLTDEKDNESVIKTDHKKGRKRVQVQKTILPAQGGWS
jgi:hypothetical protein